MPDKGYIPIALANGTFLHPYITERGIVLRFEPSVRTPGVAGTTLDEQVFARIAPLMLQVMHRRQSVWCGAVLPVSLDGYSGVGRQYDLPTQRNQPRGLPSIEELPMGFGGRTVTQAHQLCGDTDMARVFEG